MSRHALLCTVILASALVAQSQAPIERQPPSSSSLPSAPSPQPKSPASAIPAPQWTSTYREPDPLSSGWIGFGAGFAVGAVLGAVHADSGDREADALFVGTLFGLVGAFLGYHIPFMHHTVRYYQP